MVHLAINVYCWGDESQKRLLVDCLEPAARAVLRERLARRFWYTLFDARGPHVFALFSAQDGRAAELEARLCAELDTYLEESPSAEPLAREEVERRHLECRGKQLCAVDAEDGLARNNSYRMCRQPPDGYPFWTGGGTPREDELWDACGELAFWAMDQLRANSRAAPVWWTAALQRALSRRVANAAEYWRYHATTLLLGLEAMLEADEEAALAALSGAVGEQNQAVFRQVREAVESRSGAWPLLDRVVELASARSGSTPGERWGLLREVNHNVLAQLQQPVRTRIPLVLCAWQRARAGSGPAAPTLRA